MWKPGALEAAETQIFFPASFLAPISRSVSNSRVYVGRVRSNIEQTVTKTVEREEREDDYDFGNKEGSH
jgi:hypothetical protein